MLSLQHFASRYALRRPLSPQAASPASKRGTQVSDYWCPTCCEWHHIDLPIFSIFTPRCEECGAKLEEEVPPERIEIDFKELDVSSSFQEDDIDADDDGDIDVDEDDDTEDAEADGESE
jgi:hypothetical protein